MDNKTKVKNKKLLDNYNLYNLNNILLRHESLHGNKYVRDQNTRDYEIRYIPRNLQGLVRK